MSTTYDFSTPPGQYAPFTVITEDDHRAWIIVSTALGLACALLFAAIRVLVRCAFSDGFGIDDAFIGGSTLLTVIQSAVILSACDHGLGKAVDLTEVRNRSKVEQELYASWLLFIFALGLSKISIALFLYRLTPIKAQKTLPLAASGVLGAFIVASMFAVAFKCNAAQRWHLLGESCGESISIRIRTIGAFDILTEIGLVGLSVYLVWALQTNWRTKSMVVFAFAFRLLTIDPIAYRVSNFDQAGASTDLFIAEDQFIIWTQTELCYSIVSSAIPTLRPFVNNLTTHYGDSGEKSGQSYGSGYGGTNPSKDNYRGSGSGFRLSILKSLGAPNRRTNKDIEEVAIEEDRIWVGPPDAYRYGIATASKAGSREPRIQSTTTRAMQMRRALGVTSLSDE